MNRNIKALYQIAEKKERRIIGLMSGTSMDGLDIALCKISGSGKETAVLVEHAQTIPYDPEIKNKLRDICFRENIPLQKLTLLHKFLAAEHAKMINAFLAEKKIAKKEIDLIASHGQTIYHAPSALHNDPSIEHATLQIGDADQIAVATGIITLSDFRQKNIACGGEGAPLAAYGDLLLFAEKEKDVILLNMGGISNFTYLPAEGNILSSDIGPGNTLMDSFTKANFPGMEMDKDAALAMQGTVYEELLKALKDHPFFEMNFPKTTGPELFSLTYVNEAVKKITINNLTHEDILATLNKFTADTISNALDKLSKGNMYKLYVSGGGIHNPLLMQHLKDSLKNVSWHTTEEKNIPADAKEAVLFALLANEAVAGDPKIFAGVDGLPAVSMGKISFPY